MKIEVYKPDGTFYGGFQDTIPPVTIEIPNPDEGQWTFNVTALDIPHNEYPFSLITGITKYQGDFNSDGDVDGSDLALLINSGGLSVDLFAKDYSITNNHENYRYLFMPGWRNLDFIEIRITYMKNYEC